MWILKKAFQKKTWPCCRNGHLFTVRRLRPSVEVSARAARLETVSGGLLWSVEPSRVGEKNTRVVKDFQSPPACQSPAAQEATPV